ncbi:C-type lectin domain family 10 member A-like [Ruditapes philippinarum]|uniref:C-type lectin domain family 10 member A-like n=1 Tax=Ruditapes philippinarum TaxID=129788 RepID=UPI00295B2131|nr:C-type lectin domain family 10 member A-like [Ruditapes philippinarum]XP_060607281.1 C-type lectin domain family 10 member A-like [Ruditapes philippinarum]
MSANYTFYGANSTVTVYWLVKQLLTRSSAQENCENFGAQLVSIKTSAENNYLMQFVLADCDQVIWTGGVGLGGRESTFKWADGSLIGSGFTNWRWGQPYPVNNDDACLSLIPNWNFRWNDGACTVEHYSICSFN